ncbi:hypothetical protein SAMN04487980_105313 [Streptomyces sp. cf124]|uniref:VMAP-C domain-containing protein n=1 Tax=Streptomyces sp. cf124 TaxID=1761903 RepID=UPI0008F09457|nr:hypothetical protein [Streptomyces sp. cf124]SFO06645.1 hypothetical protein SAMN04487980_105313 [Streptomyces sp. cf124]
MGEFKRASGPALLLGLTEALCELTCMEEPQGRLTFADLLGRQLGVPVDVRGVRLREDVVSMVRTALQIPGGESVLVAAVRILEGMPAADGIERLLAPAGGSARTPSGPLTRQDVTTARALLDQVTDRLSGPEVHDALADELGVPLPAGLTPGQLFEHVLELNTQPDGLPPAVLLVEHAAASSRQVALSAWAEDWARRAGLLGELERRRADRPHNLPDPTIPSCLVVMVEPARDGTGDIVVRPWLNAIPGRWNPLPAEPRTTTLDGLGAAVDEAVRQLALLLPATHRERPPLPPCIEFVLPFDLLNHDVAGLTYRAGDGQPLPLALEYGVHLRSLERMRSTDPSLRARWRRRWQALHQVGITAYEWRRSDVGRERGWRTALAFEPSRTAIVLDAPDSAASSYALRAAIAEGIGLAIWDRRGVFHEERRDVMSAVLASVPRPALLPVAVQRLRRSAELHNDGPLLLGRHIGFLWDDPTRLVDVQEADVPEDAPGFGMDSIDSEESGT